MEDNFINYNTAPFNIPPPDPEEKFSITTLGENTKTGHEKQLLKLKKSVTTYTWPDGVELISSESNFHFKGHNVPLYQRHGINEFINLLGETQIKNFLHHFNGYFRTNIEPRHRITNIFVAGNHLHGRFGVGFFLCLDDGSIYHGCCGCSHVTLDDFGP